MTTRYAVYFAPKPQSELNHFGESVLGRSASCSRSTGAHSTFIDNTRWHALTEKPAHYGFHATLKAPFELGEGFSAEDLLSAVASFSQNQAVIKLKGLAPRRLSGFMALTLSESQESLMDFAQSCVETFEPFRRRLSTQDRSRRVAQGLSERQIALLDRFGYPYVAEEFRFHMTLSGHLSQQDQDYEQWVSELYSQLVPNDPMLDQIAVFAQANRQSAFVQLAEFPLSE